MNPQDTLILAALLHDIGKFRQRATGRYTSHQEHSYEFVNEDFSDFFFKCGDEFKNAIRHHHRNPTQLQHLIEKQVILADRLSASEREDEERETEDFVASPLASIMSRLKCATKEHRYQLTKLNFERNTVIPEESVTVNQDEYKTLWDAFTNAFSKITKDRDYTSAHYQTVVAILRKYTSRIPAATPWEKGGRKTVPDISLYDHLRTTAAIAACIGRELTETEVEEDLKLLVAKKESDRVMCALIKGDISGIQNFLYHIQSDGASNQLRGRSFYLQLLTETIANWVLKQFDLPVTNLLLASGGHFYILAPYTNAKKKMDELRQTISEKLWEHHRGDLACMLAGVPIRASDFKVGNFSKKWDAAAEKVNERKQQKWSEMGAQDMFQNLFEPYQNREVGVSDENEKDPWRFEQLGRQLREAEYLITYKVSPALYSTEMPKWREAINTFDMDIDIYKNAGELWEKPEQVKHVVVYRLGNTCFLNDMERFQGEDFHVSYDFKPFRPVIARTDTDKTADYDYLANASEGVDWFGALRMDVDNLGSIFRDQLENVTISRHATLSRELSLFFEGYVPQFCRDYNAEQRANDKDEILELIYAGGDDLFLVGGWSALPDIAEKIRTEFRHFVTGDHVTLSGGIAIEHKKFPLYQFAARSGDAENAAKGFEKKNAITFLQQPMEWKEFADVREWHRKFMRVLIGQNPLPRDILTRLRQIYSENELKEYRWAWRSIYYFHRLQERYKYDDQTDFLRKLKNELNHSNSTQFREDLIHVITRWTALRIRR